jgi:chemotaxis protein MotB
MAHPDDELHDGGVKAGAPWLVTWADMMAVLLTFFIVLQAFSTVSDRKFHAAMQSIQHAFDVTFPIRPPAIVPVPTPDRLALELEARVTEEGLAGIAVQDWGDRIVLSVESAFLFDVGEAALTADGRAMLDGVAAVLGESSGLVRVEGHTCDLAVAPDSPWHDNWWLSTARALTVLEELQDRGMPPERLCATGFGEHVPVAPNDTETNRARNRRVEFVLEKNPGPAEEIDR